MLLLIGLPGCGKSRFAKEWLANHSGKALRINYDDLRVEMYGENWAFNRKEEEAMKEQASIRAIDALSSGFDVIIDNTNLVESIRGKWKAIADRCGATYTEHSLLDTPIQTCIERDAKRTGNARVGRAVIERMALWNGLLNFRGSQEYIIVDMDGTLADCEHRRKAALLPTKHKMLPQLNECTYWNDITYGPCDICGAKPKMNWDIFYQGCENDPEITPIAQLVGVLADTGAIDVIVVSGRPIDKAGKATEDWLNKRHWSGFPPQHLFMRNGGDSRPDYEIKGEILDKMISNGLDLSRVRWVIDDRDQVVNMWRSRGLTCLQVADGDF
jgi:predicted kinase